MSILLLLPATAHADLTAAGPAASRLSKALQLDEPEWAQPGPYRLPGHQEFDLDSFSPSQKIVATYFFYWFRPIPTGSSGDREASTHTLPPTQGCRDDELPDPDWYERQFRDMLAAGIDFVLPDYWGEPGQYDRRVAPAPELNTLPPRESRRWSRRWTGSPPAASP